MDTEHNLPTVDTFSVKIGAFLERHKSAVEALSKNLKFKAAMTALKSIVIDGTKRLTNEEIAQILKLNDAGPATTTEQNLFFGDFRNMLLADFEKLKPKDLAVALQEYWRANALKGYKCWKEMPFETPTALKDVVETFDSINIMGSAFADHEIGDYTVSPKKLDGLLRKKEGIEFLRSVGTMLESVIPTLNAKARDYDGTLEEPQKAEKCRELKKLIQEMANNYYDNVAPSVQFTCGYDIKPKVSKT